MVTNREAYEETVGMGLNDAFFRMNRINPDAEVTDEASIELRPDTIFNSQTIWPAGYYECRIYAKKSGYKYLSFNCSVYNVDDSNMKYPICDDHKLITTKDINNKISAVPVKFQEFTKNANEENLLKSNNTNGRSSQYDIEKIIKDDNELLKLYNNDSYFNKAVRVAIDNNMSVQAALIYVLKIGYSIKNEIDNNYKNHLIRCAGTNLDLLKTEV